MANGKKITRALRDPSVFKLCKHIPMFQVEPKLLRKTLNVATFRLSQVGGHTPKTRGLNDGSNKILRQSKAIESDWRLNRIEDAHRINLFGHLPRSSCREYEKFCYDFPISLKRKYLNLRNQSVCTKTLLKGQIERVAIAVGRSSTIVRKLETMHKTGSLLRNRRPQLHEAGAINVYSDFDCLSTDCDQISLVGQSNSLWPDSLERKSISPDNSLDEIFGPAMPINRDIGVDLAQLVFDTEHHRNCAVIAPHGVTFDSTDESAASSTSSNMSINNNDDLCAFFDDHSTIASEGRLGRYCNNFEVKSPHLNRSFGVSVDIRDFRRTDQVYEDIIDGPSVSDKFVASSECLESSYLNDGEIQVSLHAKENDDEEQIGWGIEKENINAQSSLGPSRVRNQSGSSLAKGRSHLPYEETETARVSHGNHSNIYLPPHITCKSPIVTTFRLPTPPSSSDEGDDDCSGGEEEELQHASAYNTNHDISLTSSFVDETMDLLAVQEEAKSCKGATFFQLQTQYSSSERDDGDNSVESDEYPPSHVCSKTNDILLPLEDAVAVASTENIVAGPKSTLGQFKGTASIILSGAEKLTDTPIKTHSTENSGQFSCMTLVDLSDTQLLPIHTLCQRRMSLDNLTDTPCLSRQQVCQQRKSLDSLTDTPLERPKKAGLQRKRLRAAPSRHDSRDSKARTALKVSEKEILRKRIEEKYRCRFLVAEAANDDSEESDEEEAVKQIEDEEMSR